ncbi:MAG TPA: hypothetical protein VHY09_09225 [Candidatus Methylacidiphilales bacterium]|jgi:uncharacterized small protein (DUF1192 family)|nr:hypothetical protein [Candidatus Methylacidiphilales bacterium]
MDPYDETPERIQASYQKYQKEPNNPAHSLAIATLYEQQKEYANALPWLECAFDLRQRRDSVLEGRILAARIQALKKEIAQLQAELNSEKDPSERVEYQKATDQKLDELNDLLKIRKERNHDSDLSN